MTQYSHELIIKMYLIAKEAVDTWDMYGKSAYNVKEASKELAREYGVKWGALSDRIRNFMFFISHGKYGRKDEYSPNWVYIEYRRLKTVGGEI